MTVRATNQNNVDVVYGAEEKLSQAIVESYEKYSPGLIIVITTFTTDLIGDDIPSAVLKAKEKVGCDVVYSTGDSVGKSRSVGIQDSLNAMADQLICREDVERNEGSVNLINSPIRSSTRYRYRICLTLDFPELLLSVRASSIQF